MPFVHILEEAQMHSIKYFIFEPLLVQTNITLHFVIFLNLGGCVF